MTTIIVLNAVSCFLATVGLGGYLAVQRHRARKTIVRPLYVTSGTGRPRPHR